MAEIEVGENFFHPAVLTVTVGTKVRWKHVGNVGHDVTPTNGDWGGTGLIPQAGYYELTFTRAGVYEYECYLHRPGMTGKVIVIPK